jgi:hypothetical protein
MSNSFRCPRGLEWDDPFVDGADPEPTVVCPVCGEPVAGPLALPPTSLTPVPALEATLAPSAEDTDENRPTQTLSLSSLPRGDAPALVPGYEIMGELGRGGMGVVYKARQVKLNRLVALKMVLAGGHAGLQGLERFRLEAEAVAQLQHPNIVQIYEVGAHNGLPYFSMEYVDGGSLASIASQPLPPRAAAAVVETIARAIHAAHLRGIISTRASSAPSRPTRKPARKPPWPTTPTARPSTCTAGWPPTSAPGPATARNWPRRARTAPSCSASPPPSGPAPAAITSRPSPC